MANSGSLAAHAVGLIVLYSLYGVLQEKIFKSEYNGERFSSRHVSMHA
jgi:hypothetical protein